LNLPLPVPVPQKNPLQQGWEALGGLFGPPLPAGDRRAPQPPVIRTVGAPRTRAPYPTGGEIGLRKAAIARAQLESLGRPSPLVVPEAESQIDPNAPAIRL